MKIIPLTRGFEAKVDDADFECLSQWSWFYSNGYAATYVGSRQFYMHRILLEVSSGVEVDHRDDDKLNNQRKNLRVCEHRENSRNRGKQSNNTSGYKGVYLHRRTGKWRSIIMVNRKSIHLGLYNTPEEAAHEYDLAALKFHKEFARLNFSD